MPRRRRNRKSRGKFNLGRNAPFTFFLGACVGIVGFWLAVKMLNSPLVASIFLDHSAIELSEIQKSKSSGFSSVTRVLPNDLSPEFHKKPSVAVNKIEKAAVTPKRETFMPAFRSKKGPKIVFVIDDIGYHNYYEKELFNTGVPLTFAILPQLSYSTYYSMIGKKRGYEIILHQPLEPEGEWGQTDPGFITTGMNRDQAKQMLERNLKTVPDAIGINNHMGSKATQNSKLMRWIFDELKKKKMFFLDSMTSSNSIAWVTAQNVNLPQLKRNVFLDNEDDTAYIERQIWQLVDQAKDQGYAVGIGHYRKKTLDAIKKLVPKIKKQGIQMVTLQELIKQ